MKEQSETFEFDAIVIGSGTCGATIARELSLANRNVLILERGKTDPLRESLLGIARIADEVRVGKKLSTLRAITTGGSTGLYFGVVNYPDLGAFAELGIDLCDEVQAVRDELPIAPLPDELISAQALRLRDSARQLGFDWEKNDMLIDQSKCVGGYHSDARWRARSYIEEAVRHGAKLLTGAKADKIILDRDRAIGIEYAYRQGRLSTRRCRAFGTKIILAAGSAASPQILRETGARDVGSMGFYCDPGYALFGLVSGVSGTDNFLGTMSCKYTTDIDLGDANMSGVFYRLMMLSKLKLRHLFRFDESIAIGIKVKDALGGRLLDNGRFYKELTSDDVVKLKKGEEAALRILKHAGATRIFNAGLTSAGHLGGMIRIGQHVDTTLETRFKNLYVCDGSVLPESSRGTPTVPLICLAKYCAKGLLAALDRSMSDLQVPVKTTES
jgi:choline dehydrogenase-like flavoprotein